MKQFMPAWMNFQKIDNFVELTHQDYEIDDFNNSDNN